jgi:putative OPT family oligopeptide transporter
MSERQGEPYIPASRSLPEISPATLILAVALSVLMAGANAYLGLFAGMTVSASIPAAVVSMGVLRLVKGNILQNNIVQTAATSGEGVAGGVIFTIPALVLLGAWDRFHYWETAVLAGFGGILGVLFTIPLRRAMIIEQPLRFPEGVATAEVLKAGHEGGAGVAKIAVAAVVGGVFKLGATGLRLWQGTAAYAARAGHSVGYAAISVSPALIGVGCIVGLNIAGLVFAGGLANWLIAIPIFSALHTVPLIPGARDMAPIAECQYLWATQTRYLGVGAMLVGGLWALISLAPSLTRGIRASFAAHSKARRSSGGALPRTERDIPIQLVIVLALVALAPLTVVFHHFVHSAALSAFMALFVLVAGFLFSAVAAYMAGLVGSSNNPVSGITIATILTGALLLRLLGAGSQLGAAAAIFVGASVCVAAAMGGDTMQDLKAGHILGSTPWKQQIMQAVGVIAAVFVMAPILNLLHDAYVIGSPNLAAPQAGLMASVAGGIFSGDLPWGMIAIGGGIAVAIIAFDLWLAHRKSSFRTPVLAFAVGIYLPFELTTPIFVGGLVAHLVARRRGESAERAGGDNSGLLFSAGLITGEALMGIILAIPIAIAADTKVIAIDTGVPSTWPGLVLLAGLIALLVRVSWPGGREAERR